MSIEIYKLISEFCPNGVEFKEFRAVCEYVRGVTYNKSQEAIPGDYNTRKVYGQITLH